MFLALNGSGTLYLHNALTNSPQEGTMSTSRKSSQSTVNTTNTNTEEKTMTTNNNVGYTIVCPDGHSLFVTERMAQRLLVESAVAEKEYDRKAQETHIGKGDNIKPKNPDSIKYDQRRNKRTKLMKAFIHNVFRGVEMPEDELDQMIEALSK